MAKLAVNRRKEGVGPGRKTQRAVKLKPVLTSREIPAGEFKAKCLALIDEVNRTGYEIVITKRGKPSAKLVPFLRAGKKKPFIGRLEGVIQIVGDPDDLIKPAFPEEDWDMLK
ncbi:MAG TPA: type II toxin-antitoxin system prevent-host-death family antitoxin [Candidatus Binatia bacterium]|nr:type II toxin-antitoxin system prevent-host-death family antitoxin [Candidatus Binatia bacterium]